METALLIAVPAIVGLIGKAMAEGDYQKASQIRADAVAQYGDAAIPVLDRLLAQEVGTTELGKIQEDSSLRGQEVDVMSELDDIYQKGGMTAQDEAALQLADQGASQRASSDYQSLEQDLARRGQQSGGALGAALASQSSQDVVNATAQNRYRAQADARNRAFQALEASGQLAGQIRGQDYAKSSAAAGAQDSINRFNAGQRTNAAQGNNAIAQAGFDNSMAIKAARTNAMNGLANDSTSQAGRTENTFNGLATGISEGMAGYNADGTPKKVKS